MFSLRVTPFMVNAINLSQPNEKNELKDKNVVDKKFITPLERKHER